jgi:hypothetical protein
MSCTSADGTPIAFARPDAARPRRWWTRLSHRAPGPNRGPAAALAKHCTIFTLRPARAR